MMKKKNHQAVKKKSPQAVEDPNAFVIAADKIGLTAGKQSEPTAVKRAGLQLATERAYSC